MYNNYYLLNNTYEMVQIGMLCWHNDTNCTVNNIYSVLLAIMYPAGLCVCVDLYAEAIESNYLPIEVELTHRTEDSQQHS